MKRAVPRSTSPRWAAVLLAATCGCSSPPEVAPDAPKWDARRFGNHRAVIRVDAKGDGAVRVHIPWRRPDSDPAAKAVWIVDGRTGERILNVKRLAVDAEAGDFAFEPVSGTGDYYAYYFPYELTGTYYPKVSYRFPEETADEDWLESHRLVGATTPERAARLPEARVTELQAVVDLHRFDPMEVIASEAEVEELLARHPGAEFLLFPEDRKYPIRMDRIPQHWASADHPSGVVGEAARGEYFAFQVGIYPVAERAADVSVRFRDLAGDAGRIPADALTCFHTEGVDWTGQAFDRPCPVAARKVQALWMGVAVPSGQAPGLYRGLLEVQPEGMAAKEVPVELRVLDEVRPDAGDDEPWRHSRLRWLNSTLALDDEVVEPFTALRVEGRKIHCLGRSVTLGDSGLPAQAESLFAPEVTHLVDAARPILAAPIDLVVEDAAGNGLSWTEGKALEFRRREDGVVEWAAQQRAGALTREVRGRMEYDGFLALRVDLTAREATDLGDVRLEIALPGDVARYMMGLGLKGGQRPPLYEWQWDVKKNQDSAWLGDVNAGLCFSLRDENYARPLNTNFYLLKPLNLPHSWHNSGRGGCRVETTSDQTCRVTAWSGRRRVAAGETVHFHFQLYLTPFKTLDTDQHWHNRYFHRYQSVAEVAAVGANVINVHHGTDINPYINYPFLRAPAMKAYVDGAHERDMKVKIYYTVRELANRAPELFALKSLGDEIFFPGDGGGYSWLQEHLRGDYIPGWFVEQYEDAAVVNSGVSRWHNYYLEGLRWLVEHTGIDGLYIDDVAFDRTVMKRVRKILDRGRPDALIDLHSANQYNVRDGFVNSALLYLEHFPYLDRLWFGEYFDYDSAADFWLVEVSGIPFGLMGEMLQGGGNPWRGMLYGMTSRMPWNESNMPARIWSVWDEFGMEGSRMIGYWSPNCPVQTGRPDVLASAYVRDDQTLIALGSWAEQEVPCNLDVDFAALGIDPARAEYYAPLIEGFQPAARFGPDQAIPVPAGQGRLLIARERR